MQKTENRTLIVWWMRPIYKLFFATPCKHPNFWGESGEWYLYLKREIFVFLYNEKSLIYALPHINPEYGDVCTPSQKKLF